MESDEEFNSVSPSRKTATEKLMLSPIKTMKDLIGTPVINKDQNEFLEISEEFRKNEIKWNSH